MTTKEEVFLMAAKSGFALWTREKVVTAIKPIGQDVDITEEIAKLIELAKAQGAAEEREACEKLCEDIGYGFRNLYKGWPPYTGNEDGRANLYVEGQSDGAYECSEALRNRAAKPNQTGE